MIQPFLGFMFGIIYLCFMPVSKSKYKTAELSKINEFLSLLLKECSGGRIKMVYRGGKVENIFDILNVYYNPNSPDYKQVLERLFMLGEKGRHFYGDAFSGVSGRKFKLDDVGEDVFLYIFEKIAKAACSDREHHVNFFRRNDSFRNYFLDKKNKPLFLTKAQRQDERVRFMIKNYYLTLLHQLAQVDYKKKSALVSTSEEKNIAIQFAEHSRSEPGFLLHAWIPAPPSLKKHVKRAGLPAYQNEPFKKQKEISFLAGILPHYIVALEIMGKGIKFYNPAILNNAITPFTFFNGLDIDQTYFEIVLKQTNYSGYYLTDGIDIVED
jgi:hypothetical protein